MAHTTEKSEKKYQGIFRASVYFIVSAMASYWTHLLTIACFILATEAEVDPNGELHDIKIGEPDDLRF